MTGATTADSHPRRPRRRINPAVGSTAGFLALCLAVYAVVGAIWGALRPGYEATVVEGGELSLEPAFNVEFTAFISFVVATGLLGALLALVMFVRSSRTRGVWMLLWVTFCAFLGAVVFFVVGNAVTGVLHPVPPVEQLEPGASLTLVPGVSIGIGFAAAPFMAALAYWCAVLVSPEELESGSAPQMLTPDV